MRAPKGCFDIGTAAKLLASEGVENIGEQRFFKWLREKKYLMLNNMPMQGYTGNNWFLVRRRKLDNDRMQIQTFISNTALEALKPVIKKDFNGVEIVLSGLGPWDDINLLKW